MRGRITAAAEDALLGQRFLPAAPTAHVGSPQVMADQFVAFEAAFEQYHPVGASHHYLHILAVRPDRQGQGIGTSCSVLATDSSTRPLCCRVIWRQPTSELGTSTADTGTPCEPIAVLPRRPRPGHVAHGAICALPFQVCQARTRRFSAIGTVRTHPHLARSRPARKHVA